MNRRHLTVAVVGATGVVGRTMIQVLNEREFPVGELRLLASGRSAGRMLSIDGQTHEIGEATQAAFEGVDIALFSAGAGASRELAPAAVACGATVIDNSSAWRMETDIPLVVSQVNPHDLEGHEGIIANPNCSTMQLVPVLMALRDTVGLERVVVDTYQSVSGTGADALAELEGQIRAHVAGEPKQASVYPHPIAFNALPEIDVFLPNGYTKEEWKVVTESRKILDLPDLRMSCTAVRIPVHVSHSEAVHVETQRADHARSVRASCLPRFRASSSATTPPNTNTRSRAMPPAVTRSSSGECAAIRRSLTGAGSPCGSCPTTCARARQRTPWSWPRRSSSATGSPTRRRVGRRATEGPCRNRRVGEPRDAGRAPGGARGHRRRGAGVHPMSPPRDPDAGRAR